MKRFLYKTIKILVLFGILSSIVLTTLGYLEYQHVTKSDPLSNKMESILNHQDFVGYDLISPIFIEATIATEDARYWSRESVIDYEAVLRAMWRNLRSFKLLEGGSTLPQQIAKNFYYGENTSLIRKVAEIFISNELLNNYTKKDLFAVYASMNYYGDGYTGLRNASWGYFNTNPYALSEGQATLLAGLPQAPSVYQLSTNFEGAKRRQKHVLTRMVAVGYIDNKDLERIYNENVYGE